MHNYDPKKDGSDVKDLFSLVFPTQKFDTKLYKKLRRFRLEWTRKSVEYSEFLGGNSLGLQAIRFSSRDDEMLMVDIFNVAQDTLRSSIIRLPDIDSKWVVSTNPVLQTLTYTMYRFIKDGDIGNKLDDALEECYYIFAYKVLGSLISHYFKFNTTPAIAKATYEGLSNRFLIKKLGTWNAVLKHRSLDIIPPKGLHTDRFKKYTTEDSVLIINDLQGRLREMIKNIYLVFLDVKDNNKGVSSRTATDVSDSGESIATVTSRPDKYVNRLRELIESPINLIDDDLIHLVSQFVKASEPDAIKKSIFLLSETYDPKNKEAIYLEHIVVKTLAYIRTKGINGNYLDNIVEIINHMKGYWSSGSVDDDGVKLTRNIITQATIHSTGRRTKWYIAANTLATVVYLFVRAVK